MLLLLRSVQTALIIYPWTVLGNHAIAAATNPYTIFVIAVAVFLGGVLAVRLSKRPRRLLTYALVHGVAVTYSFLCWISAVRGVGPALPTPAWIRAIGLGADTLTIATEVFWFGTWILFWWRGARIGGTQSGDTDRTLRFEFELGVVIWIFAAIIGLGIGLPGQHLLAPLFAYVACSLLVLVWNRQSRSVAAIPYAAIALLLSGGLLSALLLRLLPAGSGAVKSVVGFTGSVLGDRITNLLRWLWARQTIETDQAAAGATVPTAGAAPLAEPGSAGTVFMKVILWLMVVLAGLAALAFIAVAALAIIRYLTRHSATGEVRLQGRTRNHWRTMRALWRLWRYRISRALADRRACLRRTIRTIAETTRPYDHRTYYRGLLHWGRLIGVPRWPAETPHEYAARLTATLPLSDTDSRTVTELTHLYTYILYGLSEAENRHNHGPHRLRPSYRRLFRPWLVLKLRYAARRVGSVAQDRSVDPSSTTA